MSYVTPSDVAWNQSTPSEQPVRTMAANANDKKYLAFMMITFFLQK